MNGRQCPRRRELSRRLRWRRSVLVFGLAIAVCAVAPDRLPAQTSDGGVRRFALFVGANDGGDERVRLRYAVSDAMRLAEVMYRVGGVAQHDALLLEDPAPREIHGAMGRLQRAMARARGDARRVELLFYYSGHSDERGLLLGDELMPYRALRQAIETVDADVSVALLDSCSSGSFTRLKGGRRTQPFLFDDGAEMMGYAFLTSSSDDEASQESDAIGASFFTHYVVSGLLGAADSTGDQRVTLNEVYQYAFAETLSRTSATFAGPQHPSYEIQLTGAGDLVLTDLTARTAGIALEAPITGRVYVRRVDSGQLVAEFEKYPGQQLSVSLAPATYRVELRHGTNYRSTTVTVSGRTVAAVSTEDFTRVALERNRVRGDLDEDLADVRERALAAIDTIGSTTRAAFGGASRDVPLRGARPPRGTLVREPVVVDLLPGERFYPSSPTPEGRNLHHVVFGILAADAGHTDGVVASLGMNFGTGVTRGFEMSYVGNIREGRVEGFQSSSGFNILSGDLAGVQAASVFNITDGDLRGIQGASIFNLVDGSVYGVQGAGVLNAVGGAVHGIQGSGVVSIAERLYGVQGGVVSIAREVRGVQSGLVNIGESVRGMQIGLVNVAEEVNGVTLGLFNYVRFGILDMTVGLDDRGRARLSLQHGTEHLYTIYEVSARQTDLNQEETDWEVGLGIGSRIWNGFLYLDLDLQARSSLQGAERRAVQYPSLRVSGGLQFSRRFALTAGVALDGRLNWLAAPEIPAFQGPSFSVLGEGITVFPHFFAGIRL